MTRDDEERRYPRQRGDDLLRHAIGKIVLPGVAAHVLERQYRQGRFVGRHGRFVRAQVLAIPGSRLHGLRRAGEFIAQAGDREDQARRLRVSLDLAPQAADQHVDAAVEGRRLPPGNRVQQMVPAEHPARCAQEGQQQGKLRPPERHFPPLRVGQRVSGAIEHEIRKSQALGCVGLRLVHRRHSLFPFERALADAEQHFTLGLRRCHRVVTVFLLGSAARPNGNKANAREDTVRILYSGLTAIACLIGGNCAAETQTLTLMRGIDPPHHDAQRTTSWGAADTVNMIQDTLVALDWDARTPIPYLAKSWQISPDGRTYTFRLRDDVTFCSGKKFTAADVVYTFKRLQDPKTNSPSAWRAGKIKELRAPDPYTVEYELEEPYSGLL